MATVKEVMVRKDITVDRGESLGRVCKILVTQKLSGIPVVDKEDRLVGFVSERDIIMAASKGDFQDKKVSDVMVKKVVSIEENAPADQLSQLFTDKPFRYIPVTKSDRLVGIVSRKDVINKLLGKLIFFLLFSLVSKFNL